MVDSGVCLSFLKKGKINCLNKIRKHLARVKNHKS